jgi:HK97 family phage major capsid protein
VKILDKKEILQNLNTQGQSIRSESFSNEHIDKETRTIRISFSSETPVERWWGIEILDHNEKSIRVMRLKDKAPVLLDHKREYQIGVVESIEIGSDKRCYANIRFSKSQRAEEVFNDILDGIRSHVSCGYAVHDLVLQERKEDVLTYRVTDWEPFEISITSVPADPTVGFGRNLELTPEKKENLMPPELTQQEDATQARNSERERVREILAMGDEFNCRELASEFVSSGKNPDEMRKSIISRMKGAAPVQQPKSPEDFGISSREFREFSFVRAIRAVLDQNWKEAGYEKEVMEETFRKYGTKLRSMKATGFAVPTSILTRKMSVGDKSSAGAVVKHDIMTSDFIELLRNKMIVKALGARVISDLEGTFDIPKQIGSGQTYWLDEDEDIPAESEQKLGNVLFQPKTVAAYTDLTRRSLMQPSLDMEQFVRDDLTTLLALEIDRVAIAGTGEGKQPLGILNRPNVKRVDIAKNGGIAKFAHLIALETEVAAANADLGTLGYLTNARVRGLLKTTEKTPNSGQMIWADANEPGVGLVNGYRAAVTNQVPSNLIKGDGKNLSAIIFGNWKDLIVAEWGILDILVDPYTFSKKGGVRIVCFQDVDINIRRDESFSAIVDLQTSP